MSVSDNEILPSYILFRITISLSLFFPVDRYAATTLGSGNLRQAVALPPGEDLDEWIAVNSVDFFNQVKGEGFVIFWSVAF